MQLKEVVRDISMAVPVFNYDNSISYEITVDIGYLEVTYDSNGVIGINCKKDLNITTDFIDDVVKVLENMLKNEVESNKTAWYNYSRQYER